MSFKKRSDYYERLALANLRAGDKYVDITDDIFKYPAYGIKKTVIEIAKRIRQKTGWEIGIFYYNNIQAEEEYYGEARTRPHYAIKRVAEKKVPNKKFFGIFSFGSRIEQIFFPLVDIEDDELESIFGKALYYTIYHDDKISEIIRQGMKEANIARDGIKIEIMEMKFAEDWSR